MGVFPRLIGTFYGYYKKYYTYRVVERSNRFQNAGVFFWNRTVHGLGTPSDTPLRESCTNFSKSFRSISFRHRTQAFMFNSWEEFCLLLSYTFNFSAQSE